MLVRRPRGQGCGNTRIAANRAQFVLARLRRVPYLPDRLPSRIRKEEIIARHLLVRAALIAGVALSWTGSNADAALRVVTWNVDADTDRNGDDVINAVDGTYRVPSVSAVLQSIGTYTLAGRAQRPDVISLQELYYQPSVTLGAIVTSLNAAYGGDIYAYDPTVGATTGALVGNGPNGLIYNKQTVKVLGAANIGTASGSGAPRAPMRYYLQSLAEASNNSFYLYSEHAKASGGDANALRRAIEVDAVRANADALGPNAHVIYTGDFNFAGATASNTNGSNEGAYKDLTAAAGTTLTTGGIPGGGGTPIVAGVARAVDPQTAVFINNSNTYVKFSTESAGSLFARYDLQLVTANTMPTSTDLGLRLIDKSYIAFGNSYYNTSGVLTTVNPNGGSIFRSANFNTAVTGYTQTMLNNLLAATDHLPVVADYSIFVPEPGMVSVMFVGIASLIRRRRVG